MANAFPKVADTSKPLVITPNGTYTGADIPHILKDIGFLECIHPYRTRVLLLVERLQPPGIAVTCIAGSAVKTEEVLFYGSGKFDERPEMVYGDGDGTVNMISLLAGAEEGN